MYKLAQLQIFVKKYLCFEKFYFISTVNLSNGIENRLRFSYNFGERSDFVDKFTFGNRLHELRIQNNLTQKQLAMYLGVSNKAVSKWETGEAMPRVKTLQAIAQCFGITYSDLLSETPNEEKLPPYEVYYRNKIEAKEADYVNQNKQSLMFLFSFDFVKILLYLFNILFIKVNIIYSIGSALFIISYCLVYYRFKNNLVLNIKSADYNDLGNMFCFLAIPILHTIIDIFLFNKHDLIWEFTLFLHIIPLLFILVLFLMIKKVCNKEFIQIVAVSGVVCWILYLGRWLVEQERAAQTYFSNLPPPLEIKEPIEPFFVGLVLVFLLLFNIISIATYVFVLSDFCNLSDILIVKTNQNNDDGLNKKHNNHLVIFLSVLVFVVIIWLFSMLFKSLNIFEYWNDFFNK